MPVFAPLTLSSSVFQSMMTVLGARSIVTVKAEALSEPPCTAIRFLDRGIEVVKVVVEEALVLGPDFRMMMEMWPWQKVLKTVAPSADCKHFGLNYTCFLI